MFCSMRTGRQLEVQEVLPTEEKHLPCSSRDPCSKPSAEAPSVLGKSAPFAASNKQIQCPSCKFDIYTQ